MIEQPSGGWAAYVPGAPATLSFLPLAQAGHSEPGWCTYANDLDDAPDVEVVCGGRNSKLPSAAAVWRQGNLLHFGFQQDPAQLNAVGRDLLENCIVYIAGFRADRPLGRVRSVFRDGPRTEQRGWLQATLVPDDAEPRRIAERFFGGERRRELAALSLADLRQWVTAHWQFLVPQPDGHLDACPDLTALALDLRAPEFLAGAVRALTADEASRDAARRVLDRRCHAGPRGDGEPASATAWREFLATHAAWLFFSEAAGCVWLVDDLAQSRGAASATLRGPLRRG